MHAVIAGQPISNMMQPQRRSASVHQFFSASQNSNTGERFRETILAIFCCFPSMRDETSDGRAPGVSLRVLYTRNAKYSPKEQFAGVCYFQKQSCIQCSLEAETIIGLELISPSPARQGERTKKKKERRPCTHCGWTREVGVLPAAQCDGTAIISVCDGCTD